MTTNEPTGPVFRRGNDRVDALIAKVEADPELSAMADAIRAGNDDMDRVYAMNLAVVRRAGQLTQVEMAKRLGVTQPAVSGFEQGDDMLLGTLCRYLTAAGATDAAITLTINGREVRLELDAFGGRATGRQAV